MKDPLVHFGPVSTDSSDLRMSGPDRKVLRELAQQVAELAAWPIELEKRELWYRHNDLDAVRPLVVCDPENGWSEIVPAGHLVCTGQLAKRWEMSLRKEIFWGEAMGDDRVVESCFRIPICAEESDWGLQETRTGGEHGGAYKWDPPLKRFEDMSRLHFPSILVDLERTRRMADLAHEVLGDFLGIQVRGDWWWTLGMTWTLANLRGLEQIMYDMYDYPDELHALMAFLRDGHLKKIESLQEASLLSLNNDGTHVGSGGFGWTRQLPRKDHEAGRVRTVDMWGFGESQETGQVSPEMFREFIFPYQLPVLARFGLNCYGCCEVLNKRWDMIREIPNLRRVSVSPWADVRDMAEKLGDRYILSLKPNPTYLAVKPIDEDHIRKSLRESISAALANGCHLEIIMKDNNTIAGNPQNVIRWCRIAKEEIESAG